VGTALLDTPSSDSNRPPRGRPTPTRRLSLQVGVDVDDVVTVRAAGNLDIYTTSRLRRRMARHDLTDGRVVLDVSGVTLIDSSGLGTLLSFANTARRGGSRLRLVCTPDLAGVLDIARLTDAFDLTVVGESRHPTT
jgi:anti-anti-sigma factor